MPIAKFQLPDGRIARFEVPEGTTPEQAQSEMEDYISKNKLAGEQPKVQKPQAQPAKQPTFSDVPIIGHLINSLSEEDKNAAIGRMVEDSYLSKVDRGEIIPTTPEQIKQVEEMRRRKANRDIATASKIPIVGDILGLEAGVYHAGDTLLKAASGDPAAQQRVKDFIAHGDPNHQFSWGTVAESGKAGAEYGGIRGAFEGPVGAAAGTASGGALGLFGGLVGETARSLGAPPAAAMLAEAGSGGLSSVGMKAASALAHFKLAFHELKGAQEFIETAKGIVPIERPAEPYPMDKATRKVVRSKLGKKPEEIPVDFRYFRNKLDAQNTQELKDIGIEVKKGQEPSDAMRDNLYKNMSELTDQGKAFIYSPEMTALNQDMKDLVQENQMTPGQVKLVKQIIGNQVSKRTPVAGRANQAIVNLIQKGEIYAPGEPKQVIKKTAQNAIRNRFNDYLKTNTGSKQFDALKNVEMLQNQYSALDEIPQMLRENFKDISSKSFKNAMMNIRNSGQLGKKLFVDALKIHFSDKNPKDFMKEFNRLRKPLQDSGVIDAKGLEELRSRLHKIPKNIKHERIKQLAMRVLFSTLYAEVGQQNELLRKQ